MSMKVCLNLMKLVSITQWLPCRPSNSLMYYSQLALYLCSPGPLSMIFNYSSHRNNHLLLSPTEEAFKNFFPRWWFCFVCLVWFGFVAEQMDLSWNALRKSEILLTPYSSCYFNHINVIIICVACNYIGDFLEILWHI